MKTVTSTRNMRSTKLATLIFLPVRLNLRGGHIQVQRGVCVCVLGVGGG